MTMLNVKDKEHILTTLLPLRIEITKLEQQHRHAFIQANSASFSSTDAKHEAINDLKTRIHIQQLWQLHETIPFRHFFSQVPTKQQVYDLDNAFDELEDKLQTAHALYEHTLQQLGGFQPKNWLSTHKNTLHAHDVFLLLHLNISLDEWKNRNLYDDYLSIQHASVELSIGILSHNSWLRTQELPSIESHFFTLLQQGNGRHNSVSIPC